MKIFLDANILFSASQSGSATRILFDTVKKYSDACITSPHAIAEAQKNIEVKRPKHAGEFIKITKHLKTSNAFYNGLQIDLPSQDVPIMAGAVGARCSHLWTGDRKHFGKYYGQTIHGVMIVSHSMLADILFDLGWKPVV